jgi:PST family polysaccharide transporter
MLFTPEFIPMRELFALQMVGDTLKIGSWILGYLMLGKAMVKMFVISEIVFALSFYGLTCLFTSIIGLEGVALAHAVNYALYWIVVEINVRKKLF